MSTFSQQIAVIRILWQLEERTVPVRQKFDLARSTKGQWIGYTDLSATWREFRKCRENGRRSVECNLFRCELDNNEIGAEEPRSSEAEDNLSEETVNRFLAFGLLGGGGVYILWKYGNGLEVTLIATGVFLTGAIWLLHATSFQQTSG